MNIAIIGASGAIGKALVELTSQAPDNQVLAFSRSDSALSFNKNNVQSLRIDIGDEASIARAADVCRDISFDQIIVASGILHSDEFMPERRIKQLNRQQFEQNFLINTIGPALVAKHFTPLMPRDRRAVFAVLSARVGSIDDNRLGGWYAYRCSKAATNMLIKNLSIEIGRSHKQAIIAGLHPGTVDSNLSKPFQKNVPDGKLFTPEYSAQQLLNVIEQLTPDDSGNLFAWDGQKIPS